MYTPFGKNWPLPMTPTTGLGHMEIVFLPEEKIQNYHVLLNCSHKPLKNKAVCLSCPCLKPSMS